MNDKDRAMWVDNDEGLYDIYNSSEYTNKRKWIRDNREFLDEIINKITTGEDRQHFLKYG